MRVSYDIAPLGNPAKRFDESAAPVSLPPEAAPTGVVLPLDTATDTATVAAAIRSTPPNVLIRLRRATCCFSRACASIRTQRASALWVSRELTRVYYTLSY